MIFENAYVVVMDDVGTELEHHYVFPRGRAGLVEAEIARAHRVEARRFAA